MNRISKLIDRIVIFLTLSLIFTMAVPFIMFSVNGPMREPTINLAEVIVLALVVIIGAWKISGAEELQINIFAHPRL